MKFYSPQQHSFTDPSRLLLKILSNLFVIIYASLSKQLNILFNLEKSTIIKL